MNQENKGAISEVSARKLERSEREKECVLFKVYTFKKINTVKWITKCKR